MKGLGTIVNAAAILLGGGAGLLFHKGISEKLQERVMEALAFGVILIGTSRRASRPGSSAPRSSSAPAPWR